MILDNDSKITEEIEGRLLARNINILQDLNLELLTQFNKLDINDPVFVRTKRFRPENAAQELTSEIIFTVENYKIKCLYMGKSRISGDTLLQLISINVNKH